MNEIEFIFTLMMLLVACVVGIAIGRTQVEQGLNFFGGKAEKKGD